MEIFCHKEYDSYPICKFATVEQIWGQCSREGSGSIQASRAWTALKHQEKGGSGHYWETPGPMCHPDLFSHEVCDCLDLRFSMLWTVTACLASDYSPLLLFRVGINTTSRGTWKIWNVTQHGSGGSSRGTGAQVVILVLLVRLKRQESDWE